MGHHFTRRTYSAEKYCPKCKRKTQHRVDDRRISTTCLECLDRLEQQHEDFEERAAIKEFCGNMPRADAERQAHEEVFEGKKTEDAEQIKFAR